MVSEFFDSLYQQQDVEQVLIVAKGINFIDLAGANWLLSEAERWKEKGGGIYVSGLKLTSQQILLKGGFKKRLGEQHFFADKRKAIGEIFDRLNPDRCRTCQARIFHECQTVEVSDSPM